MYLLSLIAKEQFCGIMKANFIMEDGRPTNQAKDKKMDGDMTILLENTSTVEISYKTKEMDMELLNF